MDRRARTIRANGCDPVFVNADSRGYYFTDYAPDSVRALVAAGGGSLKPVERISLLEDEWWMVRAGRHDVDLYLDVAAAMSGDETPAITDTISGRLTVIGEDIADPSERPRYEAWIRARFSPTLDTLGLPGNPGDEDARQSRRATLLQLVGVTGNDAGVQRRARELAVKYLADSSTLSGTLAPTVLRVAALSGDAPLYDQYVARLGTLGAQPEMYYRFFNTLTWFKDPALTKRTLDFAMSSGVRSQDAGTLIGTLIARPWSSQIAWEFTRSEWPALLKRLDIFQGIPAIVESFGAFCSAARAAEVKEFFASNPLPAVERTARQAVERIENCVALDARQSKPFAAWLARTQ